MAVVDRRGVLVELPRHSPDTSLVQRVQALDPPCHRRRRVIWVAALTLRDLGWPIAAIARAFGYGRPHDVSRKIERLETLLAAENADEVPGE